MKKSWHFRTSWLLSVTELPGLMKLVVAQWTRLLVKRDWISCAGFVVRLVQRCELKKWVQTWRSVLRLNIENCSRSVLNCHVSVERQTQNFDSCEKLFPWQHAVPIGVSAFGTPVRTGEWICGTSKLIQTLPGGFFLARQPPVGQGLLIHEISRSHTTTHHSR